MSDTMKVKAIAPWGTARQRKERINGMSDKLYVNSNRKESIVTIQQLSLETLNDLDPRILTAFSLEMKRAASDCMDRPLDKNDREVSLVMKLSPEVDKDTGDCASVWGEFQIKSKVPTRKSKSYNFGIRKNGVLTFNADSPDDINQKTLLDQE